MKQIRDCLFVLAAIGCSTSALAQATYDARIMDYTGLRYACGDVAEPVLKIANNGTATMLTCVVETWKNGLQVGSFNWELAVPALQGDVRQPLLPPVGDVVAGDVLEFRIISVNEQPDEQADGNILEVALDEVPGTAESFVVLVDVLTDGAPEETTWALHDQQGVVVAQGGPYSTANVTEQAWSTLEPSTCYELRVMDAAGNGMPGGYVKVFSNESEVITLDGSMLTDEFRAGVVTGTVVGLVELFSPQMMVYPNPTSGDIRLALTEGTVANSTLMVMDALGRTVMHARSATSSDLTIDLGQLPPGPYTMALRSDRGEIHRTTVIRE